MTSQEFSVLAKKVVPYTDYVYLHIKGEPLLHPELEAILDLCGQYGLHANLTTNGTLIPKTASVLLHANSLRQINISLHSFEDHSLTRLPELDSYLESILTFAKTMNEQTGTYVALRLWNLDKEGASKERTDRNTYVLNAIQQAFPKAAIDPAGHSGGRHQGIRLADRVYLNFDYEFSWPSLDAPYFGEDGSCYGLKTQLGVLVDGTVVPCCLDENGVIALGNLFTEDLGDILESPRAVAMAQGFAHRKAVEELCQHCGYRERF